MILVNIRQISRTTSIWTKCTKKRNVVFVQSFHRQFSSTSKKSKNITCWWHQRNKSIIIARSQKTHFKFLTSTQTRRIATIVTQLQTNNNNNNNTVFFFHTNSIISSYFVTSNHNSNNNMINFSQNNHQFCTNANNDKNKDGSPASLIDYFELLGIESEFDIDLNLLQSQFHSKMREYHPDQHANKSEEEQKHVLQMSSKINMAKTVLESPLWRAQHLLYLKTHAINGHNGNNNNNNNNTSKIAANLDPSKLDEELKIDDQFFLMEIMETRLNIEEASKGYLENKKNYEKCKDEESEIKMNKSLDVLYNLRENNSNVMENIIKEISKEFNSNETTNETLERIRDLLAKLIYYWRIDAEIKEHLPAV